MPALAAAAPAKAKAAAVKAALNPGFRWDGGGDSSAPLAAPQAPWSFAGAADDVAKEHASARTTSVDAKIARVLARKVRGGVTSRARAAAAARASATFPAAPSSHRWPAPLARSWPARWPLSADAPRLCAFTGREGSRHSLPREEACSQHAHARRRA